MKIASNKKKNRAVGREKLDERRPGVGRGKRSVFTRAAVRFDAFSSSPLAKKIVRVMKKKKRRKKPINRHDGYDARLRDMNATIRGHRKKKKNVFFSFY